MPPTCSSQCRLFTRHVLYSCCHNIHTRATKRLRSSLHVLFVTTANHVCIRRHSCGVYRTNTPLYYYTLRHHLQQQSLSFGTSASSNVCHIDDEEDPDDQLGIPSHPHYSSHSIRMDEQKHTYVVAMSGGVDSSVAAAMLVHNHQETNGNSNTYVGSKNSKSNVVAIHMSNWNRYDDDSNTQSCCTSLQDYQDVQSITQNILHIPNLSTFNDETTYWCHVFEPYIHNLLHYGMMGNPDIDCNTYVKFHSLLQHVLQVHGPTTTLVTGHYARLWYRDSKNTTPSNYRFHHHLPPSNIPESVEEMIHQHPEYMKDLDWLRTWGSNANISHNTSAALTPLLLSARDLSKDQSYFLAGVHAQAFHHVHFPIGDYYKSLGAKVQQENVVSRADQSNTYAYGRSLSIREMARMYKLKPVEKKRDSMGLCFIGNQKQNRTSTITKTGTATTSGYTNFISNYLPIPHQHLQYINVETNEPVYETTQPQHAVLYTPGQGMKIPGGKTKYFCVNNNYSSTNYHALSNNTATRSTTTNEEFHPITICPGTNHSSLYSDCIYVDVIHWMCTVPPAPLQHQWKGSGNKTAIMEGIQCRTRHLQPLTDCSIQIPTTCAFENRFQPSNYSLKANRNCFYRQFDSFDEELRYNMQYRITIQCHSPIRAVTPGQRVVFYTMNGLICLGSAVIVSKSRSYFELGKSSPSFMKGQAL